MRSLSLFLAALVLAATPAAAQFRAQTPEQGGLGFTVDAEFAQLSGGGGGRDRQSVGDSIGSGFGLAALGFYQPAAIPARVGLGGSYTRFSTAGSGDALNKLSLYAAGAWQIADPNTSVVPYLGGRIGYVHLNDDEFFCVNTAVVTCPEEDLRQGRTWSGLELGAVVGVDLPISEMVNFDVAGTFSWLTVGDVTAGGETIPSTSTNFSTFGLRAGVTVFPR